MERDFYSCREIAELIGIKISTVRTYCKKGKIPCVKVGRSYRIAAKDFHEWFEAGKKPSPNAETEKYLKKLEESEAKYKNLINQSLDGIVMTDFKSTLVLVNPSFCHMLDYSESELLGTNLTQYIHPEERAAAVEEHMRYMAGEGSPGLRTTRMLKKDGKTVFVETSGGPVWEANKVIGIQEIIRDITTWTRLGQELEILLEMLPSAFVINDFKGKVYRANSRVLEVTGYTKEELLNMKSIVNLYWYPEEREEALALLREKGEFYNREQTGRLKGDVMMPSEMHAKVIEIGGEKYIASLVQDITKRKNLENELKKAKEMLERTFNAVNYGIVHLDPDLQVLFTNSWLKTRLPEIEVGKKCQALRSKNGQLCSLCPALKCLESGRPEKSDVTLKNADGTEMSLQLSAFPIRNADGEIVQISEIIKDLSQQEDPGWDVFSNT